MKLCDLKLAFPGLIAAAEKMKAIDVDLARNCSAFSDAVQRYDESHSLDDLLEIENQSTIIMDKADAFFEQDSVNVIVFMVLEVSRAAHALVNEDEMKCRAHLQNAVSVSLID